MPEKIHCQNFQNRNEKNRSTFEKLENEQKT